MQITNRYDYIDELRSRLRRLPADELENAVSYYEEYFDEAGGANEIQTIAALGSPASVASKIIGEFAVNEADRPAEKAERRANPLLVTILAVFASPIALPLGFVAVAVVITVFAVIFALFVASGAVTIAGVISAIVGLWAFANDAATGMLYFGAGLFLVAVCAAIFVSLSKIGMAVFRSIQKILGNLLIRRGRK